MTSNRTRWLGLIFISLSVAIVIVDSTIVNVSIPSIINDLGINSTQVQWVQEAYTLVFAATLLVFGTLADRFGRRRILLLGVVVFTLASVVAAFSQSGNLLIGARVLQGLGGAMVLPTTLSIINATFRGRDRAIAFAVWGSTIGGMVAVGPLLGGWLTTYYSWRWAFGINVPISVIIVLGVLIFVRASKAEGEVQQVDIVGAILSIIASATLVYGLIEGRTYGWWLTNKAPQVGDWTWPLPLSIIPIAFAVTLTSGTLFVLWGRRRQRQGKSTMLAFALFAIPSFRNGNIAAMIVSLGEFGIILSLPIWLQFVLGYDALQTGLILVALAIGAFIASGFAGAFGNRVTPVTIVRIGLLAEIAGVIGIGAVVSPSASWGPLVPFLFLYGFGVGLATAQLTGVVLKDVPIDQSGSGSGTQSTARQVGSALGIAILGTVLFTTAGAQLDSRLADRGVPEAQRTEITNAVVDSAGAAIIGLEANPQTADAATDAKAAFSEGTRFAAFAAAGFLAIGFLATLSLGSGRMTPAARRREDDSSEGDAATLATQDGPPTP